MKKTAICIILILVLCVTSFAEESAGAAASDYTLEQIVIFGRHNMRAPLATKDSFVGKCAAGEWVEWSAEAGQLTDLGLLQETAMGEYFRAYLTAEGLTEANEQPADGEVRVYANSYQRTIATAKAFATGLFPIADIEVEYHEELGTMDEVFKPSVKFMSDAYMAQINSEVCALCGGLGLQGVVDSLSENIALLEEVLDFKDSQYAIENGLTALPTGDSSITYEVGEEPKMSGALKNLCSLADALVMQYYEEPDDTKAAFGHELTFEQWQQIGEIVDAYQACLFSLPSVAVNLAHPLLQELYGELTAPDRKISFLCGHDSNVISMFTALGLENELKQEDSESLTPSTPIGCNIVFQKWLGADGEEYISVFMVYQSSEKLKRNELVSLSDPPVWAELSFTGLEQNEDGMYLYADVLERFEESISAYDELPCDETGDAA